jgi:hypothetical protein
MGDLTIVRMLLVWACGTLAGSSVMRHALVDLAGRIAQNAFYVDSNGRSIGASRPEGLGGPSTGSRRPAQLAQPGDVKVEFGELVLRDLRRFSRAAWLAELRPPRPARWGRCHVPTC